MKYLKFYLLTLTAFLLLDGLWLGLIAQPIYQRALGHLMADPPDFLAAALFYPAYILGFCYLVVWPGAEQSARWVWWKGWVFGLITYGTYELTNKAVLADWPWWIVPIDILWGGFLCASSAFITTSVFRR